MYNISRKIEEKKLNPPSHSLLHGPELLSKTVELGVGLSLKKKQPSSLYIQKEYRNDGLSGYTVSSLKAFCHRYILFVLMVSLVSFPPAVRA